MDGFGCRFIVGETVIASDTCNPRFRSVYFAGCPSPCVAFGQVAIAGTGIPTSVLVERYRAGDSIDDLTIDYRCDYLSIEEAICCELPSPV